MAFVPAVPMIDLVFGFLGRLSVYLLSSSKRYSRLSCKHSPDSKVGCTAYNSCLGFTDIRAGNSNDCILP